MCTFSAKKDAYVSGSIRKGKGWEGHISSMLVKMLKSIGERAILLDVGTNIGCHALYGAINNFHVFGVEPQAVNLVKVSPHLIFAMLSWKKALFSPGLPGSHTKQQH